MHETLVIIFLLAGKKKVKKRIKCIKKIRNRSVHKSFNKLSNFDGSDDVV